MHLIIVLFVAGWFIYRRYKKNKPLVAARIAEEKEKDRLAEKRRDTKRRKWALALADILILRNGIKTKGVALAFTLNESQRQHLAAQVKKELGLPANLHGDDLSKHIAEILRRWPAGISNSPRGFYRQLASQGQVRDALAFDCMRTAFLTRCIAGLNWCDENQAWLVLLLNAQRAQDCFTSWEDYATAYVRARQVWLQQQETSAEMTARDLREVTRYLADPMSNWRKLPWDQFKIFEPN